MCKIRLRGKYQNITLLNIHAPTEEAISEKKEEFYDIMESEWEKIAQYDFNLRRTIIGSKVTQDVVFLFVTC